NADLKPERSSELEGGFESKLFGQRLGIDFTAYRRRTKDALIAAIVAPSAGTGATTVRRNLGAIQNQGLELLATAQLVSQNVFGGDTAEFRGYTEPRRIVTLTNGFEFLNHRLRVQSLFDYRGGYKAYNNTERIRCVSRNNCEGLMKPGADLKTQATVVATRDHP